MRQFETWQGCRWSQVVGPTALRSTSETSSWTAEKRESMGNAFAAIEREFLCEFAKPGTMRQFMESMLNFDAAELE